MEKLTSRQIQTLDRVKEDGALMRCEGAFQFVDGTSAHSRVIKNLIKKGALVENGDSMFGVQPQTLRAAG